MKNRKDKFGTWWYYIKHAFITLFFTSPVALFIWNVCLVVGGILGGFGPFYKTSKECWNALLIFVPVLVIYIIIWSKIISKVIEKDNTKKSTRKKERLIRLEKQYANYISLVYNLAKEHYKDGIVIMDKDFLIAFEDYLNRICREKNIKKPNSFVQAACLMYSLISEENVDDADDVSFAMKCALEVSSKPVTYYYRDGEWVEENHPKVNIVIDKNLLDSIKNEIVQDYKGRKTSIMQTANLLHLMYTKSNGL